MNDEQQSVLKKYPTPWQLGGSGDTSDITDANGKTVLSVTWDDIQSGDGGINDLLTFIVDAVNEAANRVR